MRLLGLVMVVVAGAVVGTSVAAQDKAAKSAWAGVYTEAQA